MYRKLRKAFWFIIVSFLLIVQTIMPNFAIADDNDFDMYYQDVVTEVQAGESVVYRLNLRVKGIRNDDSKMRKVVITLPGEKEGITKFDKGNYATEQEKLESLKIEEVVPTLEQTNDGRQIVYDFKNTLKIGSTYSIEIPLKTANGTVKNGQTLSPRAEYYENGEKKFDKVPEKPTKISSATAVAISKRYDHTANHQGDPEYTPRSWDQVIWRVKVTIPYNEFGQAFIDPNQDIVVTDRIQDHMEFWSAEGDVKPQNGVVTWRFKAPSIEEQKRRVANGEQNLFERDFWVRFRIKDIKSVAAVEIKNQASVSLKNISGDNINQDSNEVKLRAVGEIWNKPPTGNLGYIQGINLGPSDGNGGLPESAPGGRYNPNPSVGSGARLAFAVQYRVALFTGGVIYANALRKNYGELIYQVKDIGSGESEEILAETEEAYPFVDIYNKGVKRIEIARSIDPNLRLEEIELGVPVVWGKINNIFNPTETLQQFSTDGPEPEIQMVIKGKDEQLSFKWARPKFHDVYTDRAKTIKFDGVDSFGNHATHTVDTPFKVMKLTRKDLNLDEGDNVVSYSIRYFRKDGWTFPGGFATNVYDYYSVKPGYSGTVTNDTWYTVKTWDDRVFLRKPDPHYRGPDFDQVYMKDLRTKREEAIKELGEAKKNNKTDEIKRLENDIKKLNAEEQSYYAKFPEVPTQGSLGPRTAFVGKDLEYPTSISTAGELEQRDGNVINLGSNIFKFSMQANYPTPANAIPKTLASLLPPGITVDKDKLKEKGEWRYIETDGSIIESSHDQIEVIDNFNNTGQQLVRVKWQNKILNAKRKLEISVPVKVAEGAGKQIKIPVYATVQNKEFTTIKPTEKKSVDLDIDGTNSSNVTVATSATDYTRIYKNNLKTEKSVRGDIDKEYAELLKKHQSTPNDVELNNEIARVRKVRDAYVSLKGSSDEEMYSKYAITSFGGNIDYKLKMTNTTGEKISKMTFVDLLPGASDFGIVNYGNARGSKFNPILTGAIQVPDSWKNKVDIVYTKVFEPQRNMFDGKVDVPGFGLPNIAGLQDAKWMSERDVGNDWASVRGFKIELKPGVEWIEGQNIEVKFTMKAPEDRNMMTKVPKNANELKNIEDNKSAWNTFAVTTNGLLPVEPERVGVSYLEPLHVKVKKVDQFGKELRSGTMDLKFWIDKIEGNPGGMWYTTDGKNVNLATNNPFTFEKIDRFSTARAVNTYWITEERAPTGYKKTATRYKVVLNNATRTVTWTSTQNGPNGKEEMKNLILYDEFDPNRQGDKEGAVEITNSKEVLPETGGYGAIFYILIGGSLIIMSKKIKTKNKK